MAMYLNNADLEFLIKLENKLGNSENWSEDVIGLWTLIEKLKEQKEKDNKKTWDKIQEKRKTDPDYGRSKQEIKNREEAAKRREERRKKKENKEV